MLLKEIIEKAELAIEESRILFDEDMKKYTSFKIGGKADCLIKIQTVEELKSVLKLANDKKIQTTILGNGSNVLVLDNGIRGITILIKIDYIEKQEIINKDKLMSDSNKQVILKIGAGTKMSTVGQYCLKNNLEGFEALAGIPGTIGGAIKMNAGAYGSEMVDVVERVKCLDYLGNEIVFEKNKLNFAYRQSRFKNEKYIIIETELIFLLGEYEKIKCKMDECRDSRKEKQPIEYPSAGSTFKRGSDYITAKLIDEAGLKGMQIGGAQISEKHAGFIINKNNAKAEDVIGLVDLTKEKVYENTHKKIELEIEIIGE